MIARAGGCCERCGRLLHDGSRWLGPHSDHHRRPRGSGGSSDPVTNSPTNRLLLCGTATTPGSCHLWVESNRAAAYDDGLLVRHPSDPRCRPVVLKVGRVYLTTEGTYSDHPDELA